jgi:hypothetical protein
MKLGILFTIISAFALAFTSSSRAQGRIWLDNFGSDGPDVVYGSGFSNPGTGILDGQNGSIGNVTWTIGFYYGLGDLTGSVGNDPTSFGTTSFNGLALATGIGATAALKGPSYPGEFSAFTEYTVSGYTSGLITVEVTAYSGTDYASSILRGHSAAFTMTPSTGPAISSVSAAMPSFAINIIPEPSMIALLSIGFAAFFVWANRRCC